jgi:hypothetical protein
MKSQGVFPALLPIDKVGKWVYHKPARKTVCKEETE